MGILSDMLKKSLSKNPKNEPYNSFFISNKQEPPARDTKFWLEMYNKNPRLSPVYKMSLDIATTRGKVVKKNEDGTETPLDNHPILDLLYKPNKEYNITGTASLYLAQVYYLVKGETFGVIERKLDGTPSFMWIVPPTWVTTPMDKAEDAKETTFVNFYTVSMPNGKVMYVSPEDMFYRKNPNPTNPLARGVGRVESLGDEIETDEYMSKFAKRFFFNDATPNLIITAPEDADDEEIKSAERKWYQKFGGFLQSSKAAFLNWDAKLHVLNTSNREMDFIESRKFYRDLSIQHFGIPPEIMGNVENSNKATVVAARDIYRNEVLNPMFIEFEEALTWQILRQYENSENLKFVFVRKEEAKDDFVLETITKAYDDGALTLFEYRRALSELLKYELSDLPEDYQDVISVPSNRILVNTKKPYNEQVSVGNIPDSTESDKDE